MQYIHNSVYAASRPQLKLSAIIQINIHNCKERQVILLEKEIVRERPPAKTASLKN